jgi:hypothetical protein
LQQHAVVLGFRPTRQGPKKRAEREQEAERLAREALARKGRFPPSGDDEDDEDEGPPAQIVPPVGLLG